MSGAAVTRASIASGNASAVWLILINLVCPENFKDLPEQCQCCEAKSFCEDCHVFSVWDYWLCCDGSFDFATIFNLEELSGLKYFGSSWVDFPFGWG